MAEGGIGAVIENLKDQEKFKIHMIAAKIWVERAIALVRSAPGGSELGTDEQVAQRILDGIAERRKTNRIPAATTGWL